MQNVEPSAEPAEKDQAEKLRVEFEETEANAAKMRAKAEEIKARIAEKVREDSQALSVLTPEDAIADLDDYLRHGRIEISVILTEMAADDRYMDIKTLTTVTGLVFVHSDTYITSDDAAAKSLVEEAKFMLASSIRTDSRHNITLTPVSDLYAQAPDTDPTIIDALLKGMRTESRYADIKTVTASNGDVYFHSNKYLVDSYASTLLMVMAGDYSATIAETVREESRIYPRTTNVTIFRDQQVYGIPPHDLDVIIDEALRKPEYSDLQKIVHPSTGAVHLYSDRYIAEASAWAMMDWEEVGRANNP
jgi:hypothetical protein